MDKYRVTGMSCAACQARVEKAVGKVPGVDSCAVSLLTNSMGVQGTADPETIIKAVENAGYGAELMKGDATSRVKAEEVTFEAGHGGAAQDAGIGGRSLFREQEEALSDTATPRLRRRLLRSIAFLAVLMYFSMGHMMWSWPIPSALEGNHVAVALLEMILAAVVMLINKDFFTSGFRSLLHRAPNMDTLVALGSMASFVWSVAVLFRMTADQLAGDAEALAADMNSLYFESAAMIVTLITVGKMLEAMSKGKTTDALKALMKLAPETAVLLRDGEEIKVPIDEVKVGDEFIVRPGESIPVDGVITDGNAAINESSLTGESMPVDKEPGDEVSAATINETGYIKARATKVGRDTTLAKIIELVSDAAATKAPIAKVADRISAVFVPAVISIALAVLVIWLLIGREFGYALARGIAVLVVSCPCALGLATPVAIMVGSGKGARSGILFKTSAALEETGRIAAVALDKTGTITSGEPVVTDVIPCGAGKESAGPDYTDTAQRSLLMIAASLEKKSEHPLAGAIMRYTEEHAIEARETEEFRVLPGNGLRAEIRGVEVIGGSYDFVSASVDVDDSMRKRADELSGAGKTPIYFAAEGRLYGIIAVQDAVKEDSVQAIGELKNMGLRVVMLTGDNERTAKAIGAKTGVDEVVAEVLPGDKERAVRELQERYGKVAMVGDGINDAPALTRADAGIAIGAGTNVAIDAADVVLMNSSLLDAAAAVRLSRQTLRNIHENLFWAFLYNILLIPLAAGLYTAVFSGWTMNPMLGAAAMSLSSFCVCMNALRLNLFDPYDAGRDRKRREKTAVNDTAVSGTINKTETEGKKMEKKMVIEGMMCSHCEASVKAALEAVDGVSEAVVSHEEGTAIVKSDAEIPSEVLKKAVEAKDYTVVSVD